jgi:hypothetical protein
MGIGNSYRFLEAPLRLPKQPRNCYTLGMTLQELFAKVMRFKRGTRSSEVIEIAEDFEEVMRTLPAVAAPPAAPVDCAECARRAAADEKARAATKARVADWRARHKAKGASQ